MMEKKREKTVTCVLHRGQCSLAKRHRATLTIQLREYTMCDDMEDYGFEYSDDDQDSDLDADIENQYYNSKALLESNETVEALTGFASVVAMETEKGEWGFKALKQLSLIHI